MRIESDGDRIKIEVGPGAREAAIGIAAAHFSEGQKTRRLLIFATMAFAIVAALTVVFAPQGREAWADWIGVALVALAVGAAKLSRLRWKTPLGELEVAIQDTSEKAPG